MNNDLKNQRMFESFGNQESEVSFKNKSILNVDQLSYE